MVDIKLEQRKNAILEACGNNMQNVIISPAGERYYAFRSSDTSIGFLKFDKVVINFNHWKTIEENLHSATLWVENGMQIVNI